jgi:lipopolysaccharide/colanic/teichoic acid biosynthesis glycosyltransferase
MTRAFMKSATQPISMLVDTPEIAATGQISPWCISRYKRLFDLVSGCLLLTLASPAMLVTALLVRVSSRGPVLFRQLRVGQAGKCFSLLKFRTMTHGRQEPGLALTHQGDSRVTSAGRFLRTFKLDELPQLLNVVGGDMSLVGPRPDVPEYYRLVSRGQQQVLLLKPGVTGAATLRFRDEEGVLARVPQAQLLSFYTGTLLPKKIEMDLAYARQATFLTDLGLLFRTLIAIFVRHRRGEQQ